MLRLSVVAAALIATGVSAQVPKSAAVKGKEHCRPSVADKVAAGTRAEPRKLGDLPPAMRIATVYREIDRCPSPVVLGPVAR